MANNSTFKKSLKMTKG